MALTEATRAQAREIIARYPQPRSALLPMLHLVQSEEGYVTLAGVALCAEELGLTKAEVGAVVTFYTMFKRRPTGDWLVSVCTNTMCGVLGGDQIFATLSRELEVGHNETTEDGTVTLEHAECLAACDYAPVVTVNYEFFDQQTPESAFGPASAPSPPAAPGCARSARWSGCWPVSVMRARRPSRTDRPASRRWSVSGWPPNAAKPRRRTRHHPRASTPPTGRAEECR